MTCLRHGGGAGRSRDRKRWLKAANICCWRRRDVDVGEIHTAHGCPHGQVPTRGPYQFQTCHVAGKRAPGQFCTKLKYKGGSCSPGTGANLDSLTSRATMQTVWQRSKKPKTLRLSSWRPSERGVAQPCDHYGIFPNAKKVSGKPPWERVSGHGDSHILIDCASGGTRQISWGGLLNAPGAF